MTQQKLYSVSFSPTRDGTLYEPLSAQGHSLKHCRGISLGLSLGNFDSNIIDYETKKIVETRKSDWHPAGY